MTAAEFERTSARLHRALGDINLSDMKDFWERAGVLVGLLQGLSRLRGGFRPEEAKA